MINPKDYEYLWTDYDVNFIFTSCYLFPEFRKADIVLLYDYQKKGLAFFLSKEEHKKCSKYGVKLYTHQFSSWKKDIEMNIALGKELIQQTKKDSKVIPSLSLRELRQRFVDRVHLFQTLGGNYFFTEFFFMDEVEKKSSPALSLHLNEMGKLKFQAREVLNELYNYNHLFKPYVEEIGHRLRRKDLQWLGYDEIITLFDKEKILPSARDKQNWVLAKRTKWKLVAGKEAEIIIHEFNTHFFNKDAGEVKGLIANKGSYTGTAKVLRTVFSDKVAEEMRKVKKGDVLIANTTGPEVMAACERAGAIVTDEGGITSHAAIVSRELGIPCIVGTKRATIIFSDGDIVKVDAERGVVRKIK